MFPQNCVQIAMDGFTEVLTFILGSWRENFAMLNRKDDKSKAVVVGNPRSSDFELVRTSLMPGVLKTVGHNKDHPKPIKVYVVVLCCFCKISSHVGLSRFSFDKL